MNDPEYNELRSASWRRKLTPGEEARLEPYLAARPELQAQWEEDLALTRQLRELPDAPLSSNFTSLVLQAVDSETREEPARREAAPWWQGWFGQAAPRMAVAGLALTLLLAGVAEYRQGLNRKQVAEDFGRIAPHLANLPFRGPEVFEDFDAIQQLQPVSLSTDDDLLAALQ